MHKRYNKNYQPAGPSGPPGASSTSNFIRLFSSVYICVEARRARHPAPRGVATAWMQCSCDQQGDFRTCCISFCNLKCVMYLFYILLRRPAAAAGRAATASETNRRKCWGGSGSKFLYPRRLSALGLSLIGRCRAAMQSKTG